MSQKNKHGLSRYIRKPIKQEVLKRCGFGCVICGSCIYTYEHFDPPFEDAKFHDPHGITLLCGSHQLESSKGLLAKSTISEANQNPKCLENGYSNHMFDIGRKAPDIYLGTNKLSNVRHVFNFKGNTCFSVMPPADSSKFWRLTAIFCDGSGNSICSIVQNELRIFSSAYQFEQTGNKFSVDDAVGKQVFLATLVAPADLHIEKCTVSHAGAILSVDSNSMNINMHGRILSCKDCNFSNSLTIFGT